MFLARLRLNHGRVASLWAANPYRVHQRLMMAYEGEPRLLFRIEESREGTQILVQSHVAPRWPAAFADFPVLQGSPEHKPFEVRLQAQGCYRFRLLANPTIKRNGKRLGLLREEEQQAWLARKLTAAGAVLLGYTVASQVLQRSGRNPYKDSTCHTHLAVLFEGVLQVHNPAHLWAAVESGVGAAKGYGFGLLSLARAG